MPTTTLPLELGSAGEAVRDLQRRLTRAGLDHAGDPSGTFGPATQAAVRSFQELRGLTVDGRCGGDTWSALVEAGYRLGDRLLYLTTPMVRGDDVADLQNRLGGLGFFAHRIDGIFGPLTEAATGEFQRNAGLTTDAVCGPDTVAALLRMGGRPLPAVKAELVERESLRTAAPLLQGRRIVIGDSGGLGALTSALARGLTESGAVVDVCRQPDQSAQAAAANEFHADLYVGLRLAADASCLCAYYGRPDYESAGGRELATRLGRALPPVLDLTPIEPRAMRVPILRETRMVAVTCEIGPPPLVVERTAEVALAVAQTLAAWAATPIDG